jgi:DNA primase catalytic core
MNKVDFNDFLDKLRRDIPIEDVIQRLGTEVKQVGNKKIALCPFHNDTNPSLVIYSDNEIPQYHCFTCNAHGDSIKFVQEKKSCSFKDAVIWFVETFNNSFNLTKFKKNDVSKWIHPNQFAYDLFLQNNNNDLLTNWAEKKRKINVKSINNAGVLYLKENALSKTLKALSDYEIGLLEDAGVVQSFRKIGKDDKGRYLRLPSDSSEIFWYQNILFPIKDSKGNITGFVAREDNQDKAEYNIPKYKYSKGFKRASNFYGIDNVYNKIQECKQKNKSSNKLAEAFHLYLVEGMMDVLRLESRNYNVIGALGNKLAGKIKGDQNQLFLLKELCDTLGDIPLCLHVFLDNDLAGKEGAYSICKSLLDLKNQYNLFFNFDFVIPPDNIILKDPDEIFEKINKKISLESWCRCVTDFETAYILDCNIDEINDKYETLSLLQRAQLARRIKSHLSIDSFDEDITFNTFGVKSIIQFKDKTPSVLPKDMANVEWDDVNFIQDIQKAVSQCKNTYRVDFPIDFKSWNRFQKAGIILIEEFKEILKPNYTPAPFTGILQPREQGEPRVLALPSPELLVAEEYLLNGLVNHSMQDELSELPFVFYDVRQQKSITRGTKKQKSIHTVSFAYQVNLEVFEKHTGVGETLFRHYSPCWKDFNDFILGRIRKCPSHIETLYPARLDLHRYYDNISKSTVVDSLKPALANVEIQGFSTSESLMQWICSTVFGYSYYAPNGEKLDFPHLDKGIPQGPSLSAWLGNIVLFSVDKVMSDEVERINKKYAKGDTGSIVATYARYVDDIVLIAPDTSSLIDLQQLFSYEVSKLDLSLSSKTPPLEPQSIDNIKSWLFENRGFGQRPSGDWCPSDVVNNPNSIARAFWLKSIDRKQALSLLHDDKMNVSFDAKEIETVINTVVQKYDDLRYRDYRYILTRIWKICFLKCSNLEVEEIIASYLDKVEEYLKISQNDKDNKNLNSQNISDFVEGLNILWALLLSFESLQEIVINRNISFFRYSTKEQKEHQEFMKNIMLFITDHDLLDKLSEKYFKKFNVSNFYKKQFKFLINLRKMAILQMLGDRTKLIGKYDIENYHLLQRFAISVSDVNDLTALSEFDLSNIENRFLYFHQAIEFLELSNKDDKDKMGGLLQRALENSDKLLCKYVYCLCPNKLNEDIIGNESSDTSIKLNALQVFANCVTNISRQFSLLSEREILVTLLDSQKKNNKLYILPHPNDLNRNFIKCLIWADEKKTKIASFMAISKELDENKISTLGPNSINQSWKAVSEENVTQLSIFENIPSDNLHLTILETQKIKPPIEKLKQLVEIYGNLISNVLLKQNLITPFHILKNESKKIYEIYSSELIEDGEEKNKGYGAYEYKDLALIGVPEHNSFYWRVGVAVAGLFDLNKKILNINLCSQRINSNSNDIEDDMADFVLKQALYIFSGSKYWSKPVLDEKVPYAITDCQNNITDFLEAESKIDKMFICIYMNAKTQLMLLRHTYRDKLSEKGIAAFIYRKLSSKILLNNPSFIEIMNQSDCLPNTNKSEYTREIESFRRLIRIFKSLKSEKNDYIVDAYQSCLIEKIYKTITLSLKSHISDKTVEKSNIFMEEKLSLLTGASLAIWHDSLNDDFKDFLLSFERILNEPTYTSAKIDDITPLGWCALAIYYLHQFSEEEIILYIISDIDNMFSGLTIEYNVGSNSFPWSCDIKTKIETSCSSALNLFNLLASKKVIEVKPIILAQGMPLTSQAEKVRFSSSEGEISLQQWQFSFEQISNEQANAFEMVVSNAKISNYCWSEVYCCGKLAFVSILSEKLGDILQNNPVCISANTNDITKNSPTVEKDDQKTTKSSSMTDNKSHAIDKRGAIDKKSDDNYYLKKFEDIQKGHWRERQDRMGRHTRVALFQFNVNGHDSYRHPLTEICENCDHTNLITKEINEYKKHPDRYSYDNKTEGNYKLKSCAEYRRQQILRKVIESCNAFSVDLLLLPEYSVRPETVLFIKKILKEQDSNLTVWAGTYRLPYLGNPIKGNIGPMMAPLHVISTEIDSWRAKKYPAVALGEVFNPYDLIIEPIFKIPGKKWGIIFMNLYVQRIFV